MRAEWFDACSALVAFCKASKAEPHLILGFQNTLVRFFSMLHATALAEIEDVNHDKQEGVQAFKFAVRRA